jgi:hypothetical protein
MALSPHEPAATREITVLAEDPTVTDQHGVPLYTKVRIPNEALLPGPRGSRIEVIDFDATANMFYEPLKLKIGQDILADHPSAEKLQRDPTLHAQHVYGVAAATLFEFERSLGRSLSWGFGGQSHQLKIAPHAFREDNAYYSKADEALMFGYFPHPKDKKRTIYTCLSHDIVAHETTHALLDGLRDQLMRPSSPQQAAFHEGFADVVALLSILRSEQMIHFALQKMNIANAGDQRVGVRSTLDKIKNVSDLLGLAKEMGTSFGSLSFDALRRSVKIKPNSRLLEKTVEEHDLGEILVACVMQAFIEVWHRRLKNKLQKTNATNKTAKTDVWRVAEEGAKAAQHLLNMVIRAIDYLPPVHVTFADFLKALITSDWQICGDDDAYHYRDALRDAFAKFGIKSEANRTTGEAGSLPIFDRELRYSRANSDVMRWDRESMFRFIWENRAPLNAIDDAYTRVNSVRSAWRVAPDGNIVRETIAEYYQLLRGIDRADLKRYRIAIPKSLSGVSQFNIVGGGTLIFDEFGKLKFNIAKPVHAKEQSAYLMAGRETSEHSFSYAHRQRRVRQSLYRGVQP